MLRPAVPTRYPQAPIHSEEPADWFMLVDMLQDLGASRALWQGYRRVGESLQNCPPLVLLRRTGTASSPTWEIPSRFHASSYFNWFRWEWLPEILGPLAANPKNEALLEWAGSLDKPGSPWMNAHLTRVHRRNCRKEFFRVHSLRAMPWTYDLYRRAF